MVVWQRKSHQRAAAIERAHELLASLLTLPLLAAEESPLPPFPGALDPAAGELDDGFTGYCLLLGHYPARAPWV